MHRGAEEDIFPHLPQDNRPGIVVFTATCWRKPLKDKNAGVYIEIQGHTCTLGSEKYNLELGYKRAEQVMRYLNTEHGFALHRMNVISYGEYKPLDPAKTSAARKQNRRVSLVVME